MPPLRNIRHEQFCVEYLACAGNACEAYRRTYPHSRAWKRTSVESKSCALLAKVRDRVNELRERETASAIMEVDEACRILTEMGRGKLGDYLDEHGRIDPAKVKAASRAVLEYAEIPGRDGSSTRRLKLDAKGALALLGKYRGWEATQRIELSGSVAGVDREQLRDMFRAMTPDERAAWLQRELGEGPPQA